MRFHINIRNKIVLLVLSVALVIYVISISYIVNKTSFTLKEEAYEKVKLSVERSAFEVRCQFEEYLATARTLASAFGNFHEMDSAVWKPLHLQMMREVYKQHREVTGFWDSYEYAAFLPGYTKEYGRLTRSLNLDENNKFVYEELALSLDGDSGPYALFKQRNVSDIWDPYLDTMTQANVGGGIMMTTIAAPLQKNARFAGLVGLDISLRWLQDFIKEIKPFEGTIPFLLSGKSRIASHPQDSMLNKSIYDLFGIVAQNENLEERQRKGLSSTFVYQDLSSGVDYYVYISPIIVNGANSPWGMGICVPLGVITHSADESLKVAIFSGLIGTILLIIALWWISLHISRPILLMTEKLNILAQGDLDSDADLNIRSGDELEWMSIAMNRLLNGLRRMDALARSIGSGDLTSDITLLGPKDSLGKSLISMRDSLREAREEEQKREMENENRAWVNRGLAEFSTLLRENSNNLDMLCENFLFSIAHYVHAEMGTLYLRDDERHQRRQTDEYLLKVSYAWGEKRFLHGKFKYGEGLIGSCAMEKTHIYLTEIPDDYSVIMAGVGQAPPKCILIVPMLHEGEAIAVLELASFEPFPPHVVEFLNNLSVYVAASLFTVQVGMNTAQLLAQSQEQAEELKAQDEELRQNLEELKATQEEADRKREENESLFVALSATLYYVEYNLDGFAINASANYLERLQVTRAQIVHTHFSDGCEIPGWDRRRFEAFWNEVRSGKSRRIEMRQHIGETEITVLEFYLPLKDTQNHVYKILKLSFEL